MDTLNDRSDIQQQAASAQDGELSDQDLELVVGGADLQQQLILS